MLIPLLFSLALHIFMLFELKNTNQNKNSSSTKKNSEGKDPYTKIKVNVKNKISSGFGASDKPKPETDCKDCHECKKYYYGIGVLMYPIIEEYESECKVLYVAPGSPAEKAGIKIGDWILSGSDKMCSLRGEENSIGQFVIRRKDITFTRSIVRKKICQD